MAEVVHQDRSSFICPLTPSFPSLILKNTLFQAMQCGMQDLSSPIRAQTCALCIGSRESQPLDHEENPPSVFRYSSRPLLSLSPLLLITAYYTCYLFALFLVCLPSSHQGIDSTEAKAVLFCSLICAPMSTAHWLHLHKNLSSVQMNPA